MKIENFSLPAKILWYLVFGIGYLTLYFNYFFPTEWGKKRNTAITARQLGAKHIWGPFNAIILWGLLIAYIYLGLQDS